MEIDSVEIETANKLITTTAMLLILRLPAVGTTQQGSLG